LAICQIRSTKQEIANNSAIDARSRLSYSEIHADEQAVTMMGFWVRARAFFASYGITIERAMTDDGSCYRSKTFATLLFEEGIRQTFIRSYRPQTNGTVERFNLMLRDKCGYTRPYRSEAARALDLSVAGSSSSVPQSGVASTGPPRSVRDIVIDPTESLQ
jgi:transposase InsO family protein